MEEQIVFQKKSTKQILVRAVISIVLFALFLGLVHLVLLVANVSKPATVAVYGLTQQRQWALFADGIALIGAILGRVAWRSSVANQNWKPALALVLGLIATVIGWMNLTVATGGPGSGNGVIGSAGAFVLGSIAIVLGVMTLIKKIVSE